MDAFPPFQKVGSNPWYASPLNTSHTTTSVSNASRGVYKPARAATPAMAATKPPKAAVGAAPGASVDEGPADEELLPEEGVLVVLMPVGLVSVGLVKVAVLLPLGVEVRMGWVKVVVSLMLVDDPDDEELVAVALVGAEMEMLTPCLAQRLSTAVMISVGVVSCLFILLRVGKGVSYVAAQRMCTWTQRKVGSWGSSHPVGSGT